MPRAIFDAERAPLSVELERAAPVTSTVAVAYGNVAVFLYALSRSQALPSQLPLASAVLHCGKA